MSNEPQHHCSCCETLTDESELTVVFDSYNDDFVCHECIQSGKAERYARFLELNDEHAATEGVFDPKREAEFYKLFEEFEDSDDEED